MSNDNDGGQNNLIASISSLNEKQTEVFNKCKELLNGFSYKEAEQLLFELLKDIKTTSVILSTQSVHSSNG